MEEKSKKINLSDVFDKIDLLNLKRKGLSTLQISKMTGISNEKITHMIKHQERYKHYSGVF